jgi:hypothetical protein
VGAASSEEKASDLQRSTASTDRAEHRAEYSHLSGEQGWWVSKTYVERQENGQTLIEEYRAAWKQLA